MDDKMVEVSISIDEQVKKKAEKLFKDLGLDLSMAVNIFLNQCILERGIPFRIMLDHFKSEK